MKKKLGITIGSVIVAGVLGLGIFHASASQIEPSMTIDEIENMVTDQYPGEITELERETEFNRTVYEVEIINEKKEYDLKLDGDNGEVLDIKEKPVDSASQSPKEDKANKNNNDLKESKETEEKNVETNNEKEKTVISVEEAKEIALGEFNGTIDDIDLDEEDDRLIYEIEIEKGDQEADIEIDAYTGEVIVIDMD